MATEGESPVTFPPGQGPESDGHRADQYDRLRRRVLWSMPTGLYVIGSRSGDLVNLMTANLVMQVATSPKLVSVAVEGSSVTRRLVDEGRRFTVSILDRTDRALVRRFVKPVTDVVRGEDGTVVSIQDQAVLQVAGGLPVLAGAAGWLACEVRQVVELPRGTDGPASHVLYVGEVVGAGEAERTPDGPELEILRMEDTRMNYGG